MALMKLNKYFIKKNGINVIISISPIKENAQLNLIASPPTLKTLNLT